MSVLAFVRRMLSWFRPYPVRSAVVVAGMLVEMAWTATLPKGFQVLIDRAIAPHDSSILIRVLIFLGAGAIVVSAVGLLRDYAYARLNSEITNHLRLTLYTRVQELSLSFHAKHSAGDIAARFSTDLGAVTQALQSWLAWGVQPSLDIAVATGMLFVLDWRLALIAQLVWPLALAGPRVITPRATAASYEYKNEESRVLTAVSEALAGRTVIKALGLEGPLRATFVERLGTIGRVGMRVSFLSALLDRTSSAGVMILQVAVLGVGVGLVYRGSLSVGSLVAFQTLFMAMSTALFYLAQYVPTLSLSAAGLRRLDEILDAPVAIEEKPNARPLAPLTGAIELDRVGFAYGLGSQTLAALSLTIRHGDSVAIVGASGSGKSTLLHLLIRLHDPQSGAVRWDGVDLRDVRRADVVRQIGVVFQESFLFDLSLRENIRLGRLDATDADVETAARDAGIHERILMLPQGYETLAGERGGSLSGGERQRVAIARALVRNPSVLLLDEATSALDPATEAAVNETIARVSAGRTVISFTHRISVAAHADRVFLLDNGRLVGGGNHGMLIRESHQYAALWRKQSGLRVSSDGLWAAVSVERLRAIPILSSLDGGLLETLAGRFMSEYVRGNETIIREGENGDRFFIVVRGTLQVTRTASDGTQKRIGRLEDGDHFGELALLHNAPRNASVSTLTPATLLWLQREQFMSLLTEAPGLRARIEEAHLARLERSASASGDVVGVTMPR